jgi:hypothetical protein
MSRGAPRRQGLCFYYSRELRIDNSATRAALQMEFIPARDAAVAMAQSLIDLGIA